MEIWKEIKGYEGIYEVSNKGNVRTVAGKTTYTTKHGIKHWKQKTLRFKGVNARTGNRVAFWKDGKVKDYLVARLVAYTFYNQDYNDHSKTVNHIDGNRFNNNLENLEIITHKDNNRHAFANNLMPTKEIFIKDLKSNIIYYFSSIALANRYFKKGHYFLNRRIKNNTLRFEDYEILKGGNNENLETKRVSYFFRD
jgi:hypothetical protein